MRNKALYIIHYTLYIVIALSITSCTSSTEPKTGSLSGTVLLLNDTDDPSLDPVDHSGVTVALYEIATLDTTIVRLNSEYPGIGVNINQETEFDHRLQNPIGTSITNVSGEYKFSNIPAGIYNLVFLMEGSYFMYYYNATVSAGETEIVEELILYLITRLSGFVQGDYLLQSGKTYFIEDDCTFTGNVTMQNGTAIYINSGARLSFIDNLVCSVGALDSYWRMDTSAHLFTSSYHEMSANDYFDSVQFNGGEQDLRNGIIRNIMNGVNFTGGTIQIYNVSIDRLGSGISSSNGSVTLNRLNVRNATIRGVQAMSMADSTYVSNSIFINNIDGLILYSGGGFNVNNNYFYGNSNALLPQNCEGMISNNNFDMNIVDILQYYARCTITYNNFYYSRGFGIRPRPWARINYNNFYQTSQYFINIRKSGGSNTYVQSNLDAKNNYWKPEHIDQYLLDANDNEDYPAGQECPYYILYIPRLSSAVQRAGIR